MIPGLVWACANIAMIYANKLNGVAIGFTLSQMAVVVSTFATLVILKEKKSKKELLQKLTVSELYIRVECFLLYFHPADAYATSSLR